MEEQPTTLGRGGPEIAVPLGMGLWAWGDKYTWGCSGYDAALDVSAMRGAYSAALAGGANLFDTAEAYGGGVFSGWGASERFLGACMKPEAGGGDPAAAPADPGLLRPVVVSKYIPLPWRLFEPRCLLGALRSSGGAHGAGGEGTLAGPGPHRQCEQACRPTARPYLSLPQWTGWG